MISYRLATKEDNEQLIELTASTGMMGDTALRIDRKPDFFKLLEMRGESKAFIALDGSKIIGSLCVSLQQVYVGGQIFPFHYVGDFKVAEPYRNKKIGLQLCDNLADYALSINADLAYLNVSKGNKRPFTFFKNRHNIPDFKNIGVFKIHQFIGKKKKLFYPNFKIEPTPIAEELINFFNVHYRKYELGNVVSNQMLEGTNNFIIRDNNKILAAMCLIDTMNVKQNVVMKLTWNKKFLLKFLNSMSNVTGTSKMPALNEPVRMMYIKYFAVNNHDKQMAKLLLNHARNIIYDKGFSFVSIGLHEKDPLNACFSGIFKLTFNSVGMLLSMKNNQSIIEKVKNGIPFEDYSLV